MAPEYALWGYLTYKADIFSFGVVALEIVSGRSTMNYRPTENNVGLVDTVRYSIVVVLSFRVCFSCLVLQKRSWRTGCCFKVENLHN